MLICWLVALLLCDNCFLCYHLQESVFLCRIAMFEQQGVHFLRHIERVRMTIIFFMLYRERSNNNYIFDVVWRGHIARGGVTWHNHCKTWGCNNQIFCMLLIEMMTARSIFYMSYHEGAKDDSNILNIARCKELQGYDDHATIKFLICCQLQRWQ